jgi:hypothetical protein
MKKTYFLFLGFFLLILFLLSLFFFFGKKLSFLENKTPNKKISVYQIPSPVPTKSLISKNTLGLFMALDSEGILSILVDGNKREIKLPPRVMFMCSGEPPEEGKPFDIRSMKKIVGMKIEKINEEFAPGDEIMIVEGKDSEGNPGYALVSYKCKI